jgi:hypothetical protein
MRDSPQLQAFIAVSARPFGRVAGASDAGFNQMRGQNHLFPVTAMRPARRLLCRMREAIAVPIRDMGMELVRGAMKHRSSRILFAHWNERRGERALPERDQIDPTAMRAGLGDTFILSFNPLEKHPFRLAGTRFCALFGRELKGRAFVPLWHAESEIDDLVAIVAAESIGLVAGVRAVTQRGEALALELLLLPLRSYERDQIRLIGTLSPLSAPYWLGADPVKTLTLGEYRYLGTPSLEPEAAIPLGSGPPPRRRHGLLVYDGGTLNVQPPA